MELTKELGRDARWEIARDERTKATADGPRYVFAARVALCKLAGNDHPYFSATGELLNMARSGDNRIEACGCLHDDIRRYFPALAPVAHVHLADHRGVPMHAVANACHWSGFSTWPSGQPMSPRGTYDDAALFETDAEGLEWSPVRLANHLRVSVDRAREIRDYCAADPNTTEAMRYRCHMLEAQWQREADIAYRIITRDDSVSLTSDELGALADLAGDEIDAIAGAEIGGES